MSNINLGGKHRPENLIKRLGFLPHTASSLLQSKGFTPQPKEHGPYHSYKKP